MVNPISGELGKIHQRKAQEWAVQQRQAKSIRRSTPALKQRVREVAGALLAAAARWLQPRKTLRDGATSHGLD